MKTKEIEAIKEIIGRYKLEHFLNHMALIFYEKAEEITIGGALSDYYALAETLEAMAERLHDVKTLNFH